MSELILSGYSYVDSIYDLTQGDTLAAPYFDANPYLATLCAAGGGCRFDIGGKGKSKGLSIDRETGVIRLGPTKDIFRKRPYNGQSVLLTSVIV
jgi:hypothetical protein